jgi:nitrite reductase/ring-hydroxylating ferredoxin subunit/uncharacterized membrane protein
MTPHTLVEALGEQEWLDQVGNAVQPLIDWALMTTGGQPLKDFLHGVWLGHPLHPVLTDIPLGAWTVAVVLDALDEINGRDGFRRSADAAVTIGLAGAVGAAVTGMTDWEQLDGQPRRVGLLHGLLNTTAALLYARSLQLRKRRQRRAGRGFALLGYTVSLAAAYLGGKLVYEERIGVNRALEHLPTNPATAEFIPVLPKAELPENVLRRVEVNGAPILLVRRGARVFALAETCSHLSGPLAEGQLEGESVVCPWHGSRFALTDGRVLNGPATHPQPCFVARVRNGQIEIRLSTGMSVVGSKCTENSLKDPGRHVTC